MKRWLSGAEFDTIHPAGLTVFIAALLISLLLRKGFCGWICPIGFASNLAERLGKKLRILYSLPVWIDIPLLSIKYLLLGFFSYLILWKMDLAGLTDFHNSSDNLISDAKMLHFFLQPSMLAGSIMLGIFLVSFVFRNFWCRYLCPYGGLLGILALASPFQIKRAPDTCIDHDHQQTDSTKCRVHRLPGMPYPVASRKKTDQSTPFTGIDRCLFFLCFFCAKISGHWHTQVPVEVFQQFYQVIDDIGHP